jgi:sterol desaturase/sphingolipid hydroxylase (fatty acid hydroxylase superfamily)
VFVPLERLFALRPRQRVFRRGWSNDVVHFLLNGFLIQAGTFVVLAIFVILLHRVVRPEFQAAVAAQAPWLQFFEAVLIADLGGYVGHRLTHRVPFLWRFHAVHHSIEEMDWLAAARVHPLDQTFTRSLTILPLYLMGFTKATFGFYIAFATVQAIFIHANVRFTFGPLRWLFATPEFHHWHHSNDLAAYNKNFSAQLPLLDVLFGTAYLPKGKRPETYGTGEPVPPGYWKQMCWPFTGMGRARVAARGGHG